MSLATRTYDVVIRPHALSPRRGKVARNDALYAHLLRSAKDVSLMGNDEGVNRADQNVHAFDHFLQLLVVIGDVTLADFDASSAQALGLGLQERCRAYQCRNTLANTVSMLCTVQRMNIGAALTNCLALRSPLTMLLPVNPVAPRTRTSCVLPDMSCFGWLRAASAVYARCWRTLLWRCYSYRHCLEGQQWSSNLMIECRNCSRAF